MNFSCATGLACSEARIVLDLRREVPISVVICLADILCLLKRLLQEEVFDSASFSQDRSVCSSS